MKAQRSKNTPFWHEMVHLFGLRLNLGQNRIKQLTSFPLNQRQRREGAKTCIRGGGDGMVQVCSIYFVRDVACNWVRESSQCTWHLFLTIFPHTLTSAPLILMKYYIFNNINKATRIKFVVIFTNFNSVRRIFTLFFFHVLSYFDWYVPKLTVQIILTNLHVSCYQWCKFCLQ